MAAGVTSRADELVDMVASTIAHASSHAYQKHVCQLNEFNDPGLGPALGVSTPEDLRRHLACCLCDETSIVHMRGSVFYIYHEQSGTVVMINPKGRLGAKDGGTVFRNDPAREREGEKWYERHLKKDAERMGISTSEINDVRVSFRDFLDGHAEQSQLLAEEFAPIYQAKMNGSGAAAKPVKQQPPAFTLT